MLVYKVDFNIMIINHKGAIVASYAKKKQLHCFITNN